MPGTYISRCVMLFVSKPERRSHPPKTTLKPTIAATKYRCLLESSILFYLHTKQSDLDFPVILQGESDGLVHRQHVPGRRRFLP
jgi:hypothetical protein